MLKETEKYLQLLNKQFYDCYGKVAKVVGLTIESVGPEAKLNDLCRIYLDDSGNKSDYVMAEVVGFRDMRLILMPFDNTEGISVGCVVKNTGKPLMVKVGDSLLGHTVDGI